MKTPHFMFLPLLFAFALLIPKSTHAATAEEDSGAAAKFAAEDLGKGGTNKPSGSGAVAECPENDQACRDKKASAANRSINARAGSGMAGQGEDAEPPSPGAANDETPQKKTKKSLWQSIDGGPIKEAIGIGVVGGVTAGCAAGAVLGAGVGCAPGAAVGGIASGVIWGGTVLAQQVGSYFRQ